MALKPTHTHTHLQHTCLAPTQCLIKYTLMRYKNISTLSKTSTLSLSLFMCAHTHVFTKWGHWIIREMKKKKSQRLHRQSFQLSLFLWLSGCCLLKVMGSAHHSLLWDLVMRSQFAIWFPSTQDPKLDLITEEELLCLHPTLKRQPSGPGKPTNAV